MARQQPRIKLPPVATKMYALYVRFSENLHNGWVHFESQTEIISILSKQCLESEYADSIKVKTISPVNPERRQSSRLNGRNLLSMTERFFHRELPEELFVNAVGRFEAFVGDVAECAYLDQPIRFLTAFDQRNPCIATDPNNQKLLRMLIAGKSLADTLSEFDEECRRNPEPLGVNKNFRAMDNKFAEHIKKSASRDEAIQRFVEEKIRGIFYGDPVGIFRSDKLRLDPKLAIQTKCDSELVIYQELVGRRNVLVHNLGKIDHKYVRENPTTSFSPEDRVAIDRTYLQTAFRCMNVIAKAYVYEAARTTTCTDLRGIRM